MILSLFKFVGIDIKDDRALKSIFGFRLAFCLIRVRRPRIEQVLIHNTLLVLHLWLLKVVDENLGIFSAFLTPEDILGDFILSSDNVLTTKVDLHSMILMVVWMRINGSGIFIHEFIVFIEVQCYSARLPPKEGSDVIFRIESGFASGFRVKDLLSLALLGFTLNNSVGDGGESEDS